MSYRERLLFRTSNVRVSGKFGVAKSVNDSIMLITILITRYFRKNCLFYQIFIKVFWNFISLNTRDKHNKLIHWKINVKSKWKGKENRIKHQNIKKQVKVTWKTNTGISTIEKEIIATRKNVVMEQIKDLKRDTYYQKLHETLIEISEGKCKHICILRI